MIREVTMYQAECDGCGLESDGAWRTAELAISEVTNLDDWREIGGKLYCPTATSTIRKLIVINLKRRRTNYGTQDRRNIRV